MFSREENAIPGMINLLPCRDMEITYLEKIHGDMMMDERERISK